MKIKIENIVPSIVANLIITVPVYFLLYRSGSDEFKPVLLFLLIFASTLFISFIIYVIYTRYIYKVSQNFKNEIKQLEYEIVKIRVEKDQLKEKVEEFNRSNPSYENSSNRFKEFIKKKDYLNEILMKHLEPLKSQEHFLISVFNSVLENLVNNIENGGFKEYFFDVASYPNILRNSEIEDGIVAIADLSNKNENWYSLPSPSKTKAKTRLFLVPWYDFFDKDKL